jgi:hypothetical protein
MILYKYRSFEQLNFVADILVNKRLFCANIDDLNDPFEGRFLKSFPSQMYEDEERTIPVTGKGRVAKAIITTSGGYLPEEGDTLGWRVCSLSATPNDVRLWSLYGGSHRGVVIAFDLDVGDSMTGERGSGIFKVNTFPSLRKIDGSKESTSDTLTAKDLLTSKTQIWEYEQEYRVITKNAFLSVNGCIKAVILGPRMVAENSEILRRLSGDVPIVKSSLNPFKASVDVPKW